MRKTYLTILTIFLASASIVAAEVLVEWDIANAGSSAAVTSKNDNVTATSVTAHNVTPLNHSSYPGSFAATGWDMESYNSGKYYTFTVTANGSDLSLTDISLSLVRGNYNGSSPEAIGAENWKLCSSLDNYQTSLVDYDLAGSDINEQVAFTNTFASSLSVQDGNSVEFRLYGYYEEDSQDYSGLSNMTNGNHGGDIISGTGSNLKLYGAIPEPSSLIMIGAFSTGCLMLRRLFRIKGREQNA